MTDRNYIDLRYLPEDHPLRNTLLVDIRAEFRKSTWPEWTPIVRGGGKFEDKTYNDLDGVWAEAFYLWRAPKLESMK